MLRLRHAHSFGKNPSKGQPGFGLEHLMVPFSPLRCMELQFVERDVSGMGRGARLGVGVSLRSPVRVNGFLVCIIHQSDVVEPGIEWLTLIWFSYERIEGGADC